MCIRDRCEDVPNPHEFATEKRREQHAGNSPGGHEMSSFSFVPVSGLVLHIEVIIESINIGRGAVDIGKDFDILASEVSPQRPPPG